MVRLNISDQAKMKAFVFCSPEGSRSKPSQNRCRRTENFRHNNSTVLGRGKDNFSLVKSIVTGVLQGKIDPG